MTTGLEELIPGFIKGLVAFILAVLGWNIKNMKHDLDTVEDGLHRLKEDIPSTYLTKQDFRHFEDRIFPMLHRIDSKLDNKVDKS